MRYMNALQLQETNERMYNRRFNDEESILAREFLNEQILIPDITQGERGGRDPPGPMMPLVPEYEGAFDA